MQEQKDWTKWEFCGNSLKAWGPHMHKYTL